MHHGERLPVPPARPWSSGSWGSRDAGSARRTSTASAITLAFVLALSGAGAGAGPVAAAEAVGTSDAGIVPFVIDGGHGGNVVCSQVPSDATLDSSDRLDWQGGRLVGDVPDGLEVSIISDRSVTWSSDVPIVAVIVKGGPAANVYLYTPALFADSGLVSPVGPSGQPADISNVTFCWDPDPSDPPVDLLRVCMDEAVAADVGPIASVVGPIEIRDGAVVLSSVPDGLVVTFDALSDQVGFIAPFPVVVVVTATTTHRIHHIVPPSTSGTVPLSSNPGHGDVVLCGLDTGVVASASCADIGADLHIGPILLRGGTVDPEGMPDEVTSMQVEDGAVVFTTTVMVAGVLVTASPSELHAFEQPVMTASVPLEVDEASVVELMLCALRLTVISDPGPDPVSDPTPASDQVVITAQDPVLIPTGGGPPVRTPLSLLAFVILSLTGTTTMLLWSRGG
jgi:hypothetical protein